MSVESLSVSVGLCRLTTVGLLVELSGYCRATVGILCRSVEPGLSACRALEARAIRDAALAPVVVYPAVRTVSAPRQGTGTMFFVSPARLHVCL